jgi:hypothetical protein
MIDAAIGWLLAQPGVAGVLVAVGGRVIQMPLSIRLV